jgi:hypothetical protein
MAKVYDALRRIERERQGQPMVPASLRDGISQPFWKRWLRRRTRPRHLLTVLEAHGRGMERLAARLDRLEDGASKTVTISSDGMLLERIDAMASRLDAFEEQILRTIPRAEQLLPPLVARVTTLEQDALTRLSDVADRLDERIHRLQTRITVLGAVLVLLLVAMLLRL